MDKKVLIYAHDGVGLGHVATLSSLAHKLHMHDPRLHIYFISGYSKIHNFLDETIPSIKLPSINRILAQKILNREETEFISAKLRKDIIATVFLDNEFDYIIIDMFIWGTKSELSGIIPQLKQRYPLTKIILTFRGVIFSKEATLRFFKGDEGIAFINNNYFKIICLCDKNIIDINKEYFDMKIRIPIEYKGYIYTSNSDLVKTVNRQKKVVINFGGGYKCDELLLTLLGDLKYKLSDNIDLYVVLGDYLQLDTIKEIQKNYEQYSLLLYPSREEIRRLYPDLIIGCGGYNVMLDGILNNIPMIITPKMHDDEASIHAGRLEALSSIKIINRNKMHMIYKTITDMIDSQAEHRLQSFDEIQISDFFN